MGLFFCMYYKVIKACSDNKNAQTLSQFAMSGIMVAKPEVELWFHPEFA